MIEQNRNKLVPCVDVLWGDIRGEISKQSDLMSLFSSYATESWVESQGYITSDALSGYATEVWVESQSYITSDALSGYATEVWVSDQGYLTSVPSQYATKNWVTGKEYATQSWVSGNFLSEVPSQYATKSWVSGKNYATQSWVSNNFLSEVPSTFATKAWVESNGYLSSIPSEYATKAWVSSQDYATESWVDEQGFIRHISSDYAKKSWVEEQGYLTSASLSGYATEEYVTSALSGYATEVWVTSQGYLTSVPSKYATKSWVSAQGYLTSETIPSDIATQSWVQAQGYITSETIPTDIATQSWVLSQNYITSESLSNYAQRDDDALVPLYSRSNGYLKYKYLMAGKSAKFIPSGGASGTYGTRTVFNINDDIIAFTYRNTTYGGNGMIYKFNFDTFTFDELVQGYNYPSSELPMWTDNTGRVYYGVTYTVNLTTGEFTPWDSGVSSDFKVYQSSLNNIVKFNGSIYLIPGDKTYAYKFNESTQQFEQTLTLSGISDANWLRYKCYFNGKVIYYNGGPMYELKETVESDVVTGLYFDEVSTPYFPMTYYNVETEENTTITAQQVYEITVNGVTEHVFWNSGAASHVYQLVDGVWTPIPDFTMVSASGTSSGAILGDMMFGFGYGVADNLLVWNFGDTKESYGWDNSEFATVSWVSDQGYITSDALSGYATESWVSDQGYVTSAALTGYATESWVVSQAYITSDALSDYATKSWVQNGYGTRNWVSTNFVPQSSIWTGTESAWNALDYSVRATYTIALIKP